MPDFNKVIEDLKAKKEGNSIDPNDHSREANNQRVIRNEKLRNELVDKYSGKPKFSGDSEAISNYNNQDSIEAKARANYAEEYAPDTKYNSYESYTDPNAEGLDDLNSNSFNNFGIVIPIVGIILVFFIGIRFFNKTK